MGRVYVYACVYFRERIERGRGVSLRLFVKGRRERRGRKLSLGLAEQGVRIRSRIELELFMTIRVRVRKIENLEN